MKAAIVLLVLLAAAAPAFAGVPVPPAPQGESSRVAALEAKLAALEAKLTEKAAPPVATEARVEKVEEKVAAVEDKASRDDEIDALMLAIGKVIEKTAAPHAKETPWLAILLTALPGFLGVVGLVVKEWVSHRANVRDIDWMDGRLVNVETDLGRKPDPAPLAPVERRRAARGGRKVA